MTLNCYKFDFSENIQGLRRFGRQQRLNEFRETRVIRDRVVTHWMSFSTLCSLCWFAVDFFARSLHTCTAVARLPSGVSYRFSCYIKNSASGVQRRSFGRCLGVAELSNSRWLKSATKMTSLTINLFIYAKISSPSSSSLLLVRMCA